MAQKLLTPLKKLPQQIQNMPLLQRLQDFTSGRPTGALNCHYASVYGIMEHPVALAYDEYLNLLAIAYEHGHVEVYGMPGLSFPVDCLVGDVKCMEFLRNEGRLLLATSSSLVILELNATSGHWEKKISVPLPFVLDEYTTALALGRGVIYVGSNLGTLRQVALKGGFMTVGDDDLTSLPSLLILNKLPEDKRDALKLNTPIVSIELHPCGDELLLGYAGGTAVVVQPQAIPAAQPIVKTQPVENTPIEVEEKLEECESAKKSVGPNEATDGEAESSKIAEGNSKSEQISSKKSKTGERHATANLQAIRVQATKKFRTLSKTIKNKIDHATEDKVESPLLPVPPSPRVVRLLPYTQGLCCATWRITPGVLVSDSTTCREVLVAYDDGAYFTWTIPNVEAEMDEPVIAVNQEVVNIPYGPLPCAAIQRVIARPSVSGGVITAFVGGLPRAQHGEKHTITVLGGVEEHVCFQFGSPFRDFVVLPSKPRQPECRNEPNGDIGKQSSQDDGEKEKDSEHQTEPPKPTDAGFLLVLTDRELVAIDLTQPSWPVIPSPYLKHLDCTSVTAIAHISIPEKLMSRLKAASNAKGFDNWPVVGGQKNGSCGTVVQHPEFQDLVAMGHADGDVSVWHVVRGDCFESLGRISSLAMMLDAEGVGCHAERKNEEEAWPPFRKVGDCASETVGEGGVDTRCAVRSLTLQLADEEIVMLVGGSAGNCSMWSTAAQKSLTTAPATIFVDLLDSQPDKYRWDGHEAFKPSEGAFKSSPTFTSIFGLCELVQFNPPSAILSVAYQPRWEVLAVGSAHGFGLIDLKSCAVVYKRLTFGLQITSEPSLPSVAREAATKIAATGRQLKATLRESFRKIRKIRSQPTTQSTEEGGEGKTSVDPTTSANDAPPTKDGEVGGQTAEITENVPPAEGDSVEVPKPEGDSEDPSASKPTVTIAEKQVEIASPHKLSASDTSCGVSALALAETYVIGGIPASPKENRPAFPPQRTAALIIGTQAGALITHTLAWPAVDAQVEVKPVRQTLFRHGAPILTISALDAKAGFSPVHSEKSRSQAEVIPELPEPSKEDAEAKKPAEIEGDNSKTAAAPATESAEVVEAEGAKVVPAACHELLVCTEEQVRILSLPSLKTKHKYRFWEKTAFKPASLTHRGKSEYSGANTAEVDNAQSVAAAPDQESLENKEAENSMPSAPVATPEPDSTEQVEKPEEPVAVTSATPSPSLHRVAAFGLQRFPSASKTTTEEWHAVVALKNGRLHVLTIPGLRRILKAACCDHPERCDTKTFAVHAPATVCVSGSANLTFWPLSGCVVVANELSYSPPCRLASPVLVNGLRGVGEVQYCVCLPEWARPKPPPVPVAANATSGATEAQDTAALAAEGSHDEAVKEGKVGEPGTWTTAEESANRVISDRPESADTAKEVDDFTKDITKGILADGSGTVTVTTTESSLEKHTVIEGGNVLTTIHETQRVDGEVVKDDIIQVKSDVDERPLIAGEAEVTA